MKNRVIAALFMALGCLAHANQPLTFEDRVKAQEAIERVYYEHRIWPKENPGPKPPFEQMITRAQIEAKVTDYLKKSAALDKFWQRPLTAEQLQAEMDRMAKNTKDPATLRELFAALNNDPYLIAECLARPVLAERLARKWYAYDERLHQETRRKAEEALVLLSCNDFCPPTDVQHYKMIYRLENDARSIGIPCGAIVPGSISLSQLEFYQLCKEMEAKGERAFVQEMLQAFVMIKVLHESEGEIEIEFVPFPKTSIETWLQGMADIHESNIGERGASAYFLPRIAYLSCAEDWENGILDDMPPEARKNHTAVWTGTEMIIWGGYSYNDYINTGGRYDPSTDSWSQISTGPNVPSPRENHTAVWTGSEMIVWGGYSLITQANYFNTGGRYNPATDTWNSTSIGANVPVGRVHHSAVWTGTEMIVWGGYGGGYLNTGGRYNPSYDSWIPTSTGSNVPMGRRFHKAIWTVSEMIVWGGYWVDTSEHYLSTGGKYDPLTDVWTATSDQNPPEGRVFFTTVWTGTEMIIWGGASGGGVLDSGGRYTPSSDSWLPTTRGSNVPSARDKQTAVWTGTEMIIWGGELLTFPFCENTGARYSPLLDSWVPTSMGPFAAEARSDHTAVWTGIEMIIWGGHSHDGVGDDYFNSGAKYFPSLDSWMPTSTGINVPTGRVDHTTLWTGTEMIVWGGYSGTYPGDLDTGGRYDPVTDSWLPTSTALNVPVSRYRHTAVWTGSEMIVWGGASSTLRNGFNTGGRYDPSSDSWSVTSVGPNVPLGRYLHTAVWTGMEMVVWGGYNGFKPRILLNTGGRYNPSANSWNPTSMGTDVPSARATHSVIWTGMEMIVWGGPDNTGGRYDPASDLWIPTSTEGQVPTARGGHTVVWTGRDMIVWGGVYGSEEFNSGGRYDPLTDSWLPTALEPDAPSYRFSHTAIWTGVGMIVWGGFYNNVGGTWHYLDSGGMYFPYGLNLLLGISGDAANSCPFQNVVLSTADAFASYQWYGNGIPLPGANSSTHAAAASGRYRVVGMGDAEGCWGMSTEKAIIITFCSTTEVSPQGSLQPLRIAHDPLSSTEYYLYFEKIPAASGYNIYEGNIGTWYSHGNAPGNHCTAVVSDLGTGEMRSELSPSSGDHYYLVTAYGDGTEGPSGFSSSSVEINPLQSTCTP